MAQVTAGMVAHDCHSNFAYFYYIFPQKTVLLKKIVKLHLF